MPAVDSVYVIMLIILLGPRYVLSDKAAVIRSRNPRARGLMPRYLDEHEAENLRAELDDTPAGAKLCLGTGGRSS